MPGVHVTFHILWRRRKTGLQQRVSFANGIWTQVRRFEKDIVPVQEPLTGLAVLQLPRGIRP